MKKLLTLLNLLLLSSTAFAVKYNPGHWLALQRGATNSDLNKVTKPGVVGIQKRYTWRALEPTMGNYDFSAIQADLNYVKARGGHLLAFIEEKSFNSEIITPDYLTVGVYTLQFSAKADGYVSKRWDPFVVERMNALTAALAATFDHQDNFEGICFQESAIGVKEPALSNVYGYTPALYRDALIAMVSSAKASFANSQVFWYFNFLSGNNNYIKNVGDAVAPQGAMLGGPDILPDSYSLNQHVYPKYDYFLPKGYQMFCSAQFESYEHHHAGTSVYWTPQEIFEWGRDNLGIKYLFWNYKTWSSPAGSYNINDAYPVIAANPVFNQTAPGGTLYANDFSTAFSADFANNGGSVSDWNINDGKLQRNGGWKRIYLTAGGAATWTDYTVDVDYQNITAPGNTNVGMVQLRYSNGDYYGVFIDKNGNLKLGKKLNGNWNLNLASASGFTWTTSYTFTIKVTGDNIKVYVDGNGTPALNYTDTGTTLTAGGPGFEIRNNHTKFDNLTVTDGSVVPNQAPVLAGISNKSMNENASLTVNLSSSDADGDPIALTATGIPWFGTLNDNGNGSGSIVFNPGPAAAGNTYTVTVTASDNNGGSDSDSFTLTVNNVNEAPVLTGISNKSMNENASLTVNLSSSDADGDPIALTATGIPWFGTLNDNGDGSGSIVFNPGPAAAGNTYTVTVTASDNNGGSDSDSFTLTVNNVNQAPVLTAISNQSVSESASLSLNITSSDSDSDPITLSAAGMPSFGTLTDNGDGSGLIDLTPDYTNSGIYSITVSADDGNGGTDSDSFTVTVNNVNRQPSISSIGNKSIDENSSISVAISASDPDSGDILSLSASGLPGFATLSDNGNGSGTISVSPGSNTAGSYSITVTVDDGNASNNTASTSFTVTVNAATGGSVAYYNDFSSGVPADDFTGSTGNFAITGEELVTTANSVYKSIYLKSTIFPSNTDDYKIVSRMKSASGNGYKGAAIRFRDIDSRNWYELQIRPNNGNDLRIYGKESGSSNTLGQWDADMDPAIYNTYSIKVSGNNLDVYLGNNFIGSAALSNLTGRIGPRQRSTAAWWDYFRVVNSGEADYVEDFDDAGAQGWSYLGTDFQLSDTGGGDFAFKQLATEWKFATYNETVSVDSNYSLSMDGRAVGTRVKNFDSPTMAVKYKDDSNWIVVYVFQNTSSGVRDIKLKKKIAGLVTEVSVASGITSLSSVSNWHTVEVQVNSDKLNVWINGVQEVSDYTDADLNDAAFDANTTCGVRSATANVSLEFDNIMFYDEYDQ